MNSFPQEVIDKIQWYVYRLIDPRNGETFYVGKGKGNRIFAHIRQEASVKLDELDPKLERRYAWKLSLNKVQEAELVLPTVKGLIVGAYVPEKWLPANKENFPDIALDDRPGRIGFIGREASLEILKYYRGKRVPDSYRKKGAANPVRYTW